MKANPVGWFEIPVVDMERAVQFYEAVFNTKLTVTPFGELEMAWFAWEENTPGASGSLVKHDDMYTPSTEGTLVYFSSADVSEELGRVEAAGGSIVVEKTLIKEDVGYMAVFMDTEGNRIALHSRK